MRHSQPYMPSWTIGRSMVGLLYKESGKKRQIFMVTHNLNLAVVSDTEQLIYCSFDRIYPRSITCLAPLITLK